MTLIQLKTLNQRHGGHFFDGEYFDKHNYRQYSIIQENPDRETVTVQEKRHDSISTYEFSTKTGRYVDKTATHKRLLP